MQNMLAFANLYFKSRVTWPPSRRTVAAPADTGFPDWFRSGSGRNFFSVPVLVLDEPESNLDFKNQLIVLETIQRLSKEQGIAAIVNTHYPAHALKIGDQALLLDYHGGCQFGAVEEIVSEDNMGEAFNVEVKILDYVHQDRAYKGVIPISILPTASSYAPPQTTASHSA